MKIFAKFIVILALSVVQSAFAFADDGKIKLSFILQSGKDTPIWQNVADFKSVVEELSGGKIIIEMLDEKSFSVDSIPKTVSSGAIELGISQLGLYGKDAPVVAFLQQPFLFDKPELIRAALNPDSEIRAVIERAISDATKSKVLWWHPYGSTVVVSRNGPLLTPDTVADKMVVTADEGAAEFLSLCGARSHVFSESSMLSMMEKSEAVDAVMTAMSTVASRELWQVADTITNIRHSQILYIATVSEQVWQSLSEENRQILFEAAIRAEKMHWDRLKQIEDDSYQLAKAKGMTLAEVASNELVDWRICSSEMLENYIGRAGRNAAELMVAYGKAKAKQSMEAAQPPATQGN